MNEIEAHTLSDWQQIWMHIFYNIKSLYVIKYKNSTVRRDDIRYSNNKKCLLCLEEHITLQHHNKKHKNEKMRRGFLLHLIHIYTDHFLYEKYFWLSSLFLFTLYNAYNLHIIQQHWNMMTVFLYYFLFPTISVLSDGSTTTVLMFKCKRYKWEKILFVDKYKSGMMEKMFGQCLIRMCKKVWLSLW